MPAIRPSRMATWYGGGGLSIGNAVVFGRLAGIEAAREALADPEGGQP